MPHKSPDVDHWIQSIRQRRWVSEATRDRDSLLGNRDSLKGNPDLAVVVPKSKDDLVPLYESSDTAGEVVARLQSGAPCRPAPQSHDRVSLQV